MLDLKDLLEIATYAIIFALGIIGNILIIYTILRCKQMQSVTNVFMSSLASSDLLVILICVPVKLAKVLSFGWSLGANACKGIHYIQNVSAICSVLTLTAISIERYYAIVYPLKAKFVCTVSRARKIILIIWILSLILAVPTIIIYSHYSTVNGMYCTKDPNSIPLYPFHEIYMLCVIFIIPFLIMTFSYTVICRKLWRKMEKRSVMTNQQALNRCIPGPNDIRMKNYALTEPNGSGIADREERKKVEQVIRMLVTVVIVFAICWTPVLVIDVVVASGLLPFYKVGTFQVIHLALCLMSYSNSSLNPIIYGFMSKNFRDNFLTTCRLPLRKRNEVRPLSPCNTKSTTIE